MQLSALSALDSLGLAHNSLTFSEGIPRVGQLTELLINRTAITHIPPCLAAATRLQTLNVQDCRRCVCHSHAIPQPRHLSLRQRG